MDYIIIDTSSILFGLKYKTDVFKSVHHRFGLTPVISRGVVRELAKISLSNGKERKYAGVALELMARHKIKVEPDNTYVDAWIVKASKKYRNVLTNDTALKKRLRSAKISVHSVVVGGRIR